MGLEAVFGVVGVVNFAHDSFCMLGACLGHSLVAATGSFWSALLPAPLAVTLGAVFIERLGLRPLYGRNPLDQLLLTFALSLVFSNLVLWIWGGDTLSIAKPAYLGGFVSLGGTSCTRSSGSSCAGARRAPGPGPLARPRADDLGGGGPRRAAQHGAGRGRSA